MTSGTVNTVAECDMLMCTCTVLYSRGKTRVVHKAVALDQGRRRQGRADADVCIVLACSMHAFEGVFVK
jgi:hypothetical protein